MTTIRTSGNRRVAALMLATLAMTFTPHTSVALAADKDNADKPAASKPGPQGGDLRAAGEHHVELTFHDGALQLFIYKPDGKSPMPIQASRLTALVTIPGKAGERRVTLSAKPLDSDDKGHSSRFVADAAYIKAVEKIEATVGMAIDRKPHRVTFHAANRKPDADGDAAPGGRRKTVTFFGVAFEISVSTPKAVLDRLSERMDAAVKLENAGKLDEALKAMRELRADLPDDVTSVGLDEAIARVEGKMNTKDTARDIDQRIAAAIDLANMDKHAEALAALKQIKKDLPQDVKAPGLDAAIAEIEKKLAEKKGGS